MFPHVWMYCIRCINTPIQDYTPIGARYQRKISFTPYLIHYMDQLSPVIFCMFSNSCCQEVYRCTDIWPCPLGGIQGLGHYIMEHISLVSTQLLTILINLVEFLCCSTSIITTPSWLYPIKFSYGLIDVIYHADLDSAGSSVVKCHPKVVVNLASVDSYFSL